MKRFQPSKPRAAQALARITTLAAAAAVVATLAGCADMSGITPVATVREPASLGLPATANATQAPQPPAEWWHDFGDTQLDSLIAKGLASSPNLKLAQARLARAQAAFDTATAASRPQLGGEVDVQRQLFTQNGLYPAPLAGNRYNSGTIQLNASWEIDFFGKHESAIQAAIGSARSSEAEGDAARILLASNITRSYFQLSRIESQLEVARRTLAQRTETLNLVRDRLNAGLDTRLELRQSEGGLPDARQQIEALSEQATLTRNAIAALVGEPTIAPTIRAPQLAAIRPAAPATVLPADLLGRRADIVAARWRVEAATADVKNAKTQFYPNVNLGAFIGLNAIGLDRLLQSSSEQWGVGPAIRLPIFDAGRLRANLRGKTADLDAAVESYNVAVIDAVRDVADQTASLQSIGIQQAEQQRAQEAAESAYEIAVQRYKAGLGNYLNVLTAETSVLVQRRQGVDLAARKLDTQVQLVRALGGGWQPSAGMTLAASSGTPSSGGTR